MKKSLIALAVLAASGASFAQVTVTGNLKYGYQSTTTATNNGAATTESAGLGAETARVAFTAKEDLGGGFAATATMKLNSGAGNGAAGGAGGTATSDDTTLMLATPVGGLVLGTVRAAEYLSGGVAGVGSYYAGWDSKVLTPRTNRDFWAFVVPVGDIKFMVGQQEKANTNSIGSGYTGATAIGAPLSNSALSIVGVTYAAGPLVADAQYLAYKDSGVVGNNKDTTRISANYDLGVAKLGAGYQVSNALGAPGAANPKVTDYLIAAKVPMGASSFGVSFASRTWDDAAATLGLTNGTGTGYSLEYGYAMSKRTSVIANYARWTQVSSGMLANADASSQYQLLLSHSF